MTAQELRAEIGPFICHVTVAVQGTLAHARCYAVKHRLSHSYTRALRARLENLGYEPEWLAGDVLEFTLK